MSSPESAVLFEVANGVASITLNRPEQMNSINGELSAGLMDALKQVRSRDDIRCAVITGNGRAFCAGADLRSRDGGPAASSGVAGLFRTDDSVGFHEFDGQQPGHRGLGSIAVGHGLEGPLRQIMNRVFIRRPFITDQHHSPSGRRLDHTAICDSDVL